MKHFNITKLRLLCLLLVCAIALSCATGCSTGGDALDRVLSKGVMRFGVTPDFAPISCDTADGVSGLSVDIALEIASRLNVEPEFVFIEQDKAVAALENGEIDCYLNFVAPDIKSTSTVLFIDTGLDYRQVAVTPPNSTITRLVDLKQTTVAVVSESDAAAALSDAAVLRENIGTIAWQTEEEAAIDLLRSGDCSALIISEPRILYELRSASGEFVILDDALSQADFVFAFRIGDDTLHERIQIIFDDMSTDGQFKTLVERWMGSSVG